MNRKEMLGTWYDFLKEEFDADYMKELMDFIRSEYKSGHALLPRRTDIFQVFRETDFNNLKMVIVGIEPYIQEIHSSGIAFASNSKLEIPKALNKVYETFNKQIQFGVYLDIGANDCRLKHLTDQGILLLNSRLTVREGKYNSHKFRGWEMFTSKIILKLAKEKENLIFSAWGSNPKLILSPSFEKYKNKHYFHSCEHPMIAYNDRDREWDNKDIFNETNNYLNKINKKEITW